MVNCSVPNCSNNSSKNPELGFFRLPPGKELRKRWIVNMRRDPSALFKVKYDQSVDERA